MKISNEQYGMTLVEVMIALVIIMGIAMIAQKYHSTLILNNGELLRFQDNLLLEESQFDQSYRMP